MIRYRFAHRGGAHGQANTLDTFAAALAMGATGLETDAWRSLDGAVILDHDGVLPGTREPIAGLPRDRLPAYMPTLDDLYERCGTDFDLAIDVKDTAVATAIVNVARRFEASYRLWLVEPASSAPTPLELGGAHRAVTIRGNVLRSPRRQAVVAQARAAGVEALNARWLWWSRALVAETHALGMLAFGYDAQRRLSLDRCARIGLDAVFSDRVAPLLATR